MHAFERARYLAHQRLRKMMSSDSTEHTPERTVVIVDMQDYFIGKDSCRGYDGSFQELIIGTCDLVRLAKTNQWGIVLVEFGGLGRTTQQIVDEIGDYPHVDTVIKNCEDGGEEVVDCLRGHPKWSNHLLVCGVYGDACVPATVKGLFEHSDLVEVDVVTDLVTPEYESDYCQDYGPPEPPEREVSIESLLVMGLQKSLVI